jgi:hypothetical protein
MTILRITFISALIALLCFAPLGCSDQATIASLLQTVGTAVSSLEAIEGNTTLASQLQKDFTTASQDVLAWQPGTASQDVIQALNLVESDLNLLPVSAEDSALVDLAVGTIDAILTDITAKTPATVTNGAVTALKVAAPHAQLSNPPKNSKAFRKAWNKELQKHPTLSKAHL